MSQHGLDGSQLNNAKGIFTSANTVATGAAQNVAHGLGRAPTDVLIIPTGGNNGAGAAGTQFPTITEGAHTDINVVVTVTAGSTFKVQAF